MSVDFEERLRAGLAAENVRVPYDEDAVLAEGRESVRNRRMGWTVAGLATLAVVASVVTPLLVARTVPAVPAPEPVATSMATPSGQVDDRVWTLDSRTGSWVGEDPVITLRVAGNRISGNSGCGDYTGDLARSGASWRISGVTITAPIPCPYEASERMNRFLDRLENATSAQPYADGTLRVRTPDGDLVFAGKAR